MTPRYMEKAKGAPALLRPEPWRIAKPRKCLRCTRMFNSANAGVRLCAECRKLDGG